MVLSIDKVYERDKRKDWFRRRDKIVIYIGLEIKALGSWYKININKNKRRKNFIFEAFTKKLCFLY